MRTLKFRIWDGNNKHFVYPDILELNAGLEYQQFTGLLDKNKVEIYEGDIVQEITGLSIVKWDEADEHWAAFILANDRDVYAEILGTDLEYEVVGNIYEGA